MEKGFCFYISCKHNKENISCKHCKNNYCMEHIKPTIPSLPDDSLTELFKDRYIECHPCLAFFRQFMKN